MDCIRICLPGTVEDYFNHGAVIVGILFLLLYAYAWGYHWHRLGKEQGRAT